MDRLTFETPDLTSENIEKIAALFPNCVTEMRDASGKLKHGINFEMLKQMLSPDVVDGDECYEFTWVGKKASIVEANKPIRKTLRPCPEESKNWDTTENLYIEGDNLEVLKLLQESYLGKVKMIYIDPPYNTGNDFIYADDFMRSQEEENEQMGMYDEEDNRLFKNTDTNGRFHSDWCSMMYSRLMLARNLLVEDGVIFISIDDNELENLKKLCEEIFGEVNFVANIVWKHTQQSKNDEPHFSRQYNHTVVYAKNKSSLPHFYFERTEEDNRNYSNPDSDPKGLWRSGDVRSPNYRKTLCYTITAPNGTVIQPPANGWRWSEESFKEKLLTGEIKFKPDNSGIIRKIYLCDQPGRTPENLWEGPQYGTSRQAAAMIKELFDGVQVFDTPKPYELIKRMLEIASNADSLILDFFSGSATTAHAVMQLNAEDGGHRKFIMVQLPEPCDEKSEAYKAGYKNICEIGKERIRRAGDQLKSALAKDGIALRKMVKQKNEQGTLMGFTYAEWEESPEVISAKQKMADELDTGFRVLKLDDSNMKDVYYAADEYDQGSLADMVSNIKEDRTDLDLLFGCLLDWGLLLSMPYRSEQIDGCTVHTYNDGDLIACFDANVPESVVKEIAKRKPLRAVFRDSSFADSPAKINVFEIFKLYMPEDADDISKRVRVI